MTWMMIGANNGHERERELNGHVACGTFPSAFERLLDFFQWYETRAKHAKRSCKITYPPSIEEEAIADRIESMQSSPNIAKPTL